MAKTFEQLKAALGDWLGMNTTRLPDSVRGDMVNMALRALCRLYDLRLNEASDTFATVASQRGYALPATWSRPHTLWYVAPSTGAIVTLGQKSKEEFDLLYPDQAKTGDPGHYTIWGTEIQLGRTPQSILTINRNYYALLELADGSPQNENAFTSGAWEVLLFKALADSARYGIEDARVPVWQARARELEDQLSIEHAHARSSGRRVESRDLG